MDPGRARARARHSARRGLAGPTWPQLSNLCVAYSVAKLGRAPRPHALDRGPGPLPPTWLLPCICLARGFRGFVTKPWEAEEKERSASQRKLGLARPFPEGRASCDLSRALPSTPAMAGWAPRGQAVAIHIHSPATPKCEADSHHGGETLKCVHRSRHFTIFS